MREWVGEGCAGLRRARETREQASAVDARASRERSACASHARPYVRALAPSIDPSITPSDIKRPWTPEEGKSAKARGREGLKSNAPCAGETRGRTRGRRKSRGMKSGGRLWRDALSPQHAHTQVPRAPLSFHGRKPPLPHGHAHAPGVSPSLSPFSPSLSPHPLSPSNPPSTPLFFPSIPIHPHTPITPSLPSCHSSIVSGASM